MKAEIIATGTELLLGEITDTNTPFLAGQLAALGIDLYYASTVGDNYERLLGALRQGWQRSDIIILTGGLGPTQGDITREVIASLLGEKIQVNDHLKQDLIGYFASVGRDMPQSNIKQATLIPSASALPNVRGTAPGWWVEKEGRIIIALPGPPLEMQTMWQNQVLPRLEKRTEGIILSRTLKTLGLSEAAVNDLVLPFLSAENPTLAIYAKADGIHLRITAKAVDRETARRMISGREADIRQILKDRVWGTDEQTIDGAVGQLLRSKGLTLAVAESFTGGFLSYTLAAAPDSSLWFKGAIIATTPDAGKLLGLTRESSGVANLETAAAMAASVRNKLTADIGLGLDGVEAADAAFIAIDAGPGRPENRKTCRARPNQLVRRASYQALFNLRDTLLSV